MSRPGGPLLEMLRKRPRPAAEATRAASGISRAAVGTSRATLPHGDFRLLSVAPSPCLDTRAPPPTTGRPAAPGARVSSRARPRASPRRACRAWTTRGVSILWTPPALRPQPPHAHAPPGVERDGRAPGRVGFRRARPAREAQAETTHRGGARARAHGPPRRRRRGWLAPQRPPPHLRKLPHDSDFIGPESFPRRQRDWIGYYIFFALCFASFVIGTNGVTEAEPAQLWRLADYRGRLCGVDEGVAGKPYLWHPHADHRGVDEGGDVGVCVRRCPLAHQWVCVPADANVTDPNAYAHVPARARRRSLSLSEAEEEEGKAMERFGGGGGGEGFKVGSTTTETSEAARMGSDAFGDRRSRRSRGSHSRRVLSAQPPPPLPPQPPPSPPSPPPRPLRRPPRRRTRARAARGTTPC